MGRFDAELSRVVVKPSLQSGSAKFTAARYIGDELLKQSFPWAFSDSILDNPDFLS